MPIILYSQNYISRNLSAKDGLPSNTIYSLAEDDHGHIWFGTKNGATRYDGRVFKTLNSSDGLLDNEVLSIHHLGKNKMIAISFLDKFSFGDGYKFYTYEKFISPSNLSRFVFNSKKTPYRNPTIISNNEQSYFINLNILGHRIYEVNKNKIYDPRMRLGLDTISYLAGLHRLNDRELILFSRYKSNYTTRVFLHSNSKIYRLNKNVLLPDAIQSHNNHIYLSFKDTIWAYVIDRKLHNLNLINKVTLHYVPHKLAVINNHVIALNQSGTCTIYDTLLKKVNGLDYISKIENVSDILEDNNKNIWISTLTNGVFFLKNSPIQKLSVKEGLFNEDIHSIAILDSHSSLIADNEGRLYTIKNNRPKLVFEVPKKSKKEFNIVYKILRSNEKTILLTNNPSYNVLVLNKYFDIIYKKTTDIELTKSLYKIDDKHVLLGGISSLHQLDLTNYKLEKIPIGDIRYSDIYITKTGDYWISSNNGVYCFQNKQKKMIYLGAQYKNCQYRASTICETDDGLIWVGTASHGLLGFYNYQPIVHINYKHGLSSGYIHSLIPAHKKLWLSTNTGLYSITYSFLKKTVENIRVTSFNGIGNLNLGEINSLQMAFDKIYLGTSNGLFQLYTKDLNTVERVNTVLNAIKINNADSPIRSSYHLPYSLNNISLKYTGISFGQANEHIYFYRMKGIEENFQRTIETIKEYGPLKPGEYFFEVYCGNESGEVLGKKTQIRIVIEPDLHQKLWFQVLCILIALFLTYYLFKKIETSKKKALNTKLHISELEMQAIRAQMNPHFIFNCLNGIQQLINVQDNEKANKYIAKFAKLIRQTLELSKNNTISLSEEIDFLENYLYLEEMRFQDKFDFEIICDSEIDYNQTKIPSMLLQPYVENSIRHGIKYLTNKKGQIIIEFKKKENTILCTITDNGIGRKASAEMKYSNSIEYQSRGTELNQKRIASYNKMNQEKIDLLINDLQNEKGLSIGTQVIITLQIK